MLHEEIDEQLHQLLYDIRRKDEQLQAIKEEVCKADRDFELLSVLGAIRNMRRALEELEVENKKLKEDLYRLTHKWE